MTPAQFAIVMQALSKMDSTISKVDTRVRRVEVTLATITGGVILGAFLINAGILKIG
jgi:hypothetical protein